MADRDPYMVLGVAPISRPEELKRAYRELSKKYHPDLHKDIAVEAQERMKECTSAYEILSNRQKREDYDGQAHFKPRVPRGFATMAKTPMVLSKPEPRGPGILQKLAGLFVKVEQKPQVDAVAARTHFTMGMTLAEKEAFFPQAKQEFAAAMKADPGFLEAAFNYGVMSYKLGEFDDARVGFQKATRIKPQDAFSRQMLELLRPMDLF